MDIFKDQKITELPTKLKYDARNKRKIFLDMDKQSINIGVLKKSAWKIQCTNQKCFHGNKKVIKFCSKHAGWLQFQ
jgi:hypothetical protein